MTFRPAFDMPETAAEAAAVIEAWGSPSCYTFHHARAKRCADLLFEAFPILRDSDGGRDANG